MSYLLDLALPNLEFLISGIPDRFFGLIFWFLDKSAVQSSQLKGKNKFWARKKKNQDRTVECYPRPLRRLLWVYYPLIRRKHNTPKF